MFVGIVSSEYDMDFRDTFEITASKWNGRAVQVLNEDFSHRKTIEVSPNKNASLFKHEIRPLMTRCTGSVEYDPESGKVTIKGSAEFETGRKENEASNDNDAGKGTSRIDNDPPDSRDRDGG